MHCKGTSNVISWLPINSNELLGLTSHITKPPNVSSEPLSIFVVLYLSWQLHSFTNHLLHLEDRSWQRLPSPSGIAPKQLGQPELLEEQEQGRQQILEIGYRLASAQAS
jgi:hypothetical protein